MRMLLPITSRSEHGHNESWKGGAEDMYRIMVVEDDLAIATAIKKQLEAWEYTVYPVEDFKNVLTDFQEQQPDLVLMDIMLPFFNGYHWCGEIRKLSNVPIVFISSASENMNIVMAINMGGDDFISKPFDLSVLTAKVQAVLRRSYGMGEKIPVLEHRGARLNLQDTTLSYGDVRVELSKNEYRILQVLLESKGRIVSRDTLMTKLWQTDSYVEENTLTVNIGRLRKKLDGLGLTGFITTKIGGGYIVETEGDF